MSSNPPFLPISTAAVSCWSNGSFMLSVFASDGYTVTQRVSGPNGWTDGTFSQPGDDVSATAWADNSGFHIRVYCTSENVTTEWCQDPGQSSWYQGQYALG